MSATMKHCTYCEWLEEVVDFRGQSTSPPQEPLESYNFILAVPSPPTAPTATSIPAACPASTPVTTETLEQTANTPELKVPTFRRGRRFLRYLEVLLWSFVPATAVLAIDALSGMVFGRESAMNDTDRFFVYVVLMIAYVSVGLALSRFVYRLSVLGITAVSLLTMVGVRLIIVPFIPPQLVMGATNMELALAIAAFNSLFAWMFVSLAIGAGVLALRLTESEPQFAEALDGKRSLKDKASKKSRDAGTCSKCAQVTRTADEDSFLGKRPKHFCEHCNAFIGANPVKALLWGLAETGLGVVSVCGWSIVHKHPLASTSPDTFVGLFLVLIVADGVRRAFAAAKVYSGIYDRYNHEVRDSESFQTEYYC